MYVFITVFTGHISRDQMAGKGVERMEHKEGQSDMVFEHLERYDMNEEFRIEKWVVELFGYLFVGPFLSLNSRPLKTNAWFPPWQCLLSAVAITTAVVSCKNIQSVTSFVPSYSHILYCMRSLGTNSRL